VRATTLNRIAVLAALGIMASSLAACGSGDNTASAGNDRDKAEKARLEFSRCMRQHGVDLPDPKQGPGGGVLIQGTPNLDTPQGRRAMDACQKYLEAARPKLSAADKAKFRDAFVKFSACMRKEGIDLPDPTQGGGGQRFRLRLNGDPRTRKAMDKCRKLIPGGGPGGKPPAGGGN
jgi:hypothetical protein